MDGSGAPRSLCRSRSEPQTPTAAHPRPGLWFLKVHTLERMREMGVGREEVVAALDWPEVRYPASRGRFIARRGRLAICFRNHAVVTVLWRGRDFIREAC